MLHVADCPASDEHGGPPLFLEQGVVPTELRCHDVAVTMQCALCTQTRAKDDEPSRSQVRDEEHSV